MLEYLVTSKARRRLLSLLWGEKAQGSVSELAALAGVSFASAHAELKAMQQVLLVDSHNDGSKEVFSANQSHPHAVALRALLASDAGRVAAPKPGDETLKRNLKALGAPLRGVEALGVDSSEQMETLVKGVGLARRDPVVARTLPLCFWRLRDVLDVKALAASSARPEDKHALGFFLELTSELGGDRRLLGLAETLRDGRVKLVRDFFHTTHRSKVFGTFPLAEKWGFRMNMDLDAFRTLFDKFSNR